jgi:hypothetical protein
VFSDAASAGRQSNPSSVADATIGTTFGNMSGLFELVENEAVFVKSGRVEGSAAGG